MIEGEAIIKNLQLRNNKLSESYVTIKDIAKFEYEDRKSLFIGEAFPVQTEADALMYISAVKKKYPDAKHHVYAYILRENQVMRFTDDSEPQGTAGMPILDVIRKNKCTDTLIVVTRYFGGTLLGTGGLVKAYTSAAVGALNRAGIITYAIYSVINFTASYSDYQRLIPLFGNADFHTDDVKFSDQVIIIGKIKKEHAEKLINDVAELTSGRTTALITAEKFDYIQN